LNTKIHIVQVSIAIIIYQKIEKFRMKL